MSKALTAIYVVVSRICNTCTPAKKRPRYIEETKHELFPNHLSQDFNIEEKNTVWCTDFTYIRGWDGKFQYTCSIRDLSDRIRQVE